MAEEASNAAQNQGGEVAMAKATAADPSYTEGFLHRLSMTLTGALRVSLAAGSALIGKVGGAGVTANANFTPTAVSYTAGNIIAAAQEFAFTFSDGTPVPAGSLIRIISTVIKIDATALIASEAAYSAYAYSVTPPSARANNAAWTLASGDLSAYRGSLSLGTPVDLGAALHVKTQQSDQQDIKLTGTSLWLELVNSGTFTGAAVARQVFLYGFVV